MKCLTVFFSWLLIFALGLGNALAQTKPTSAEKQATFKKQVVEWGTNKQVSGKLNSGEKFAGRIAEIQNELFVVQAVSKDGKVTSTPIHFSDLNKLSPKNSAGRTAGFTALGVLAAVGAVFVVLFAVYAASES